MICTIENKIFSWKGSSKVLDANNTVIYNIKGKFKFFSPTRKKVIYDINNTKLFTVRNKWFNWFSNSALIYDSKGKKLGKIRRSNWSFDNSFTCEGFDGNYAILGRLMNRTLTITQDEVPIATLTKEWTFMIDKFTLETEDIQNLNMFIAFAIAIDNIKDKRERDSKRD